MGEEEGKGNGGRHEGNGGKEDKREEAIKKRRRWGDKRRGREGAERQGGGRVEGRGFSSVTCTRPCALPGLGWTAASIKSLASLHALKE